MVYAEICFIYKHLIVFSNWKMTETLRNIWEPCVLGRAYLWQSASLCLFLYFFNNAQECGLHRLRNGKKKIVQKPFDDEKLHQTIWKQDQFHCWRDESTIDKMRRQSLSKIRSIWQKRPNHAIILINLSRQECHRKLKCTQQKTRILGTEKKRTYNIKKTTSCKCIVFYRSNCQVHDYHSQWQGARWSPFRDRYRAIIISPLTSLRFLALLQTFAPLQDQIGT